MAPALYALGQHAALVAADQRLQPGECLAYVVTTPARARETLDVVTTSIQDLAGVAANLGKTHVYNRAGGPAPRALLNSAKRCGPGTPLKLRRLLQELPLLPDLQCAWLILAMCAAPCADHLLRTLPPDLSASYARGHDDAVWQCLRDLLGEPDDRDPEVAAARRLALLPARLGGLGLQCAERVAPPAYWAAWADALPVLRLRRPEAAARCLAELEAGSASFALCLRAAAAAGAHLTHAGWEGRPEWRTIHDGLRPAHLASGARAGSIAVLALVQPVFATPSCCRPSRRPRRRCCVRSLGRALPHGSAPSPARPAPQYHQTACSSLAAATAPAAARRTRQMRGPWTRLRRRCRCLQRSLCCLPAYRSARPASQAVRACVLRRIWCHTARRSAVLRCDAGLAACP